MDREDWERANAEFLTDSLEWLRERLESYIAELHGEAKAVVADAARAPRRQKNPAVKKTASEHVPIDSKMNPPPALAILGRRFELTPFELDVLTLCVAFELDTRIAGLCARAHDDPLRAYPTFALALTLFDDACWDVTSFERPLRRWQLVDVERRSALPLALSPLHSDARTVDFVKGFNRIDERLAMLTTLLPPADVDTLPPSHSALVERIETFVGDVKTGDSTIQLIGPDSSAKVEIARATSQRLGSHTWLMKASWLPPALVDVDEIARLWQREALISPTLLVLDAEDAGDDRESESARSARRLLSRLNSSVLLMTRAAWHADGETPPILEVRAPTPPEQLDVWNRALKAAPRAAKIAPQLAEQFSLDIPTVERIAETAMAKKGDDLGNRIWDECLFILRPRLDTLAQRIDVKATWDDIVLPNEQMAQLREIVSQVRGRYTVYEEWGFAKKMSRGLGISVLCGGISGSGKTMAAEVMASELRLPLYRIDLSAVVSKYIGETPKNLRSLFDAAEAGGFILFFDEADALFGKRSEVKDSHDRYANIEVNYLLQRIEAYRGLAILATNSKGALDSAFLRRLRFIINFPHPSQADRKTIWEKSFAAKVPLKDLDYDRLSRFSITGGTIHNASIASAFAAAAGEGVVTMPVVLAALRAEYRKVNLAINEADFQFSESPAPRTPMAPAEKHPAK
jgi:hypothetical protein